MLAQFQSLYPKGCIISELVEIFQGKYIVRVSIIIEGVTRFTAMAAAETVETAEDQARNRALTLVGLPQLSSSSGVNSSAPVSLTQVQPTVQSPKVVNPSHTSLDTTTSQWSVSYHPEISPVTTPDPQHLVGNQAVSEYTPSEEPVSIPSQDLEPFPQSEVDIPSLPTISPSNVTPFTPRSYPPTEDVAVQPVTSKRKKKSEPVNLSDVIAKTDVQIERLGWTPDQGKEYLIKTYGKRGRSLLSEEELLDFLRYLESQPDPIAGF
ncbi:hypothetical protein B6N60_04071 [Richelia sinica FACHB-800]|uniref:Uncharacterized protein n=1 Tax=Richelia sinica FACHB-800 TaxID=1357546 RepID=A0A975TAW5_9NOST|nr:hypothetical protein [Richelia sinica]MBD2664802.1 hypothetical protein [Richelia sinica FACHB-800]QXE25357.1 hypothetical protein B6N60_04071 [Richelia sinica FACHB-800]